MWNRLTRRGAGSDFSTIEHRPAGVEAYKAALLAAKSIGYSRGCSGTHAAEGIAKLGIAAQLKALAPSLA
jgi:hypothetical protein